MEQARIPVAVAPGEAAWAVDAIRRGGGEPVGLGEKPSGLVWTDPGAVEELGDVLRAYPGISWVQLPMAGIERVAKAGVLDRRRRWTSAKGAYAEPVAEHALALLLAGLRCLPERARALLGAARRADPIRPACHRLGRWGYHDCTPAPA